MKRVNSFNNAEEMCTKVALVERNDVPLGCPLVNVKAVGKKAPTDLVELAMEIQKADSYIHANACNKLQVIAQQVKFLQVQAQKVLIEARTNMNLHHVACNFVKVPGNVYHLYKRTSGQQHFSMLSPEEWTNCPHEFMGSFRLENDHSWTPIEHLKEKDCELQIINKILGSDQNSIQQALLGTPMEL